MRRPVHDFVRTQLLLKGAMCCVTELCTSTHLTCLPVFYFVSFIFVFNVSFQLFTCKCTKWSFIQILNTFFSPSILHLSTNHGYNSSAQLVLIIFKTFQVAFFFINFLFFTNTDTTFFFLNKWFRFTQQLRRKGNHSESFQVTRYKKLLLCNQDWFSLVHSTHICTMSGARHFLWTAMFLTKWNKYLICGRANCQSKQSLV